MVTAISRVQAKAENIAACATARGFRAAISPDRARATAFAIRPLGSDSGCFASQRKVRTSVTAPIIPSQTTTAIHRGTGRSAGNSAAKANITTPLTLWSSATVPSAVARAIPVARARSSVRTASPARIGRKALAACPT